MILSDKAIAERCRIGLRPMIEPFSEGQIRKASNGSPVISYGLSSAGYDACLSLDGFKIFSPAFTGEVDPKAFNSESLISAQPKVAPDGSIYWLLPPNSYALGVTVETFNIPRNVVGICMGKSTYARCGLIVNCTPLEPGWSGRLVLEFSNSASVPVRVYASEGVAQVLFFELDGDCRTSYADRNGKYQYQKGIVTAKV